MHSRIPELDLIIEWQLEQAQKGYYDKIDPRQYAKAFEGNPNEAYHLLDCTSLAIHMSEDNFAEVFCLPNFHPKSIVEILELVHPNHIPSVFQFMEVHLANEIYFEMGKDSVVQTFMNKNDEMILKTSTPLIADEFDHVIWVLEQYRNVTGLIPNGQYSWAYKGPNAEKITKSVQAGLGISCPLTGQELIVLRFVGRGLSSQKTADNLFISKNTVDTHRRNILRKMKVENTTIAYQMAQEMGFLA